MVSVTNLVGEWQRAVADQACLCGGASHVVGQHLGQAQHSGEALCHDGAREILPYIMDVLASHRSLRAMVPHLGG